MRAFLSGIAAFALLLMHSPTHAADRVTSYVEGEGGVPLAVTVSGNTDGPEILFLHGIGLGAESFSPQLDSDLAKRFHMVAFDLRGHGMSGKPFDKQSYTDPAKWAEDVNRVITATGLTKPIIVAWSYGTLVAADYIRYHGTDRISAIVLIGGSGGLVPFEPSTAQGDSMLTAALNRARELRSNPSLKSQTEAAAIITPMLIHEVAPDGWLDRARQLQLMVPAYVQAPLRLHPAANGDLVSRLQNMPFLIIRGDHDPSLPLKSAQKLVANIPKAQIISFDGAGHSVFAERPGQFNDQLAQFVDRYWTDSKLTTPKQK